MGKNHQPTPQDSARMPTVAPGLFNTPWWHYAAASALFYLVWLLLTASADPAEWVLGLGVAVLTALLSAPHLSWLDDIRWRPVLLWHFGAYLGAFFMALLRSNVDMARRVLSPSLPINPAVVEVRTQLQSSLGKLVLANSITLTPGTLTIDVQADRLLVHWIDSHPGKDLVHATAVIAGQFERHLRECFK
jgi:multicomponent Na+:H+ antiporter subunit E